MDDQSSMRRDHGTLGAITRLMVPYREAAPRANSRAVMAPWRQVSYSLLYFFQKYFLRAHALFTKKAAMAPWVTRKPSPRLDSQNGTIEKKGAILGAIKVPWVVDYQQLCSFEHWCKNAILPLK